MSDQQDLIPAERKMKLDALANIIGQSLDQFGQADIIAVCTHNSRRSQLMEVLLRFIADKLGLKNLHAYSGGTEATAFNHRMVSALRNFGFGLEADADGDSENPQYKLDLGAGPLEGIFFSKRYDDAYNPQNDFIAVMVCSEADADCPFVPGAYRRFSLPYEDPKWADDTKQEAESYRSKVMEIGREVLYMIRRIN